MLNLFQHPFLHPRYATRPAMAKEPCVYILASQPYGTIYIGVTSNLLARLYQHREGKIRGFTSRYEVFRLVHLEHFGDIDTAIAREKQLKHWHRRWKINLIEQDNPHWLDMAVGFGFDPKPPRT
jgi:putative endonuclease